MADRIENQIERFAPGFRDCIAARHAMGPAEMERRNANLVGGDIGGGALGSRAAVRAAGVRAEPVCHRHRRRLSLCSSSTPPGIGVHGMCGHHRRARARMRSL
jgi:phytoene dehydrogenase-like protein